MYEQVANFIKELGFPISVGKNTEVLKELAVLVRNLNSKNEGKK